MNSTALNAILTVLVILLIIIPSMLLLVYRLKTKHGFIMKATSNESFISVFIQWLLLSLCVAPIITGSIILGVNLTLWK